MKILAPSIIKFLPLLLGAAFAANDRDASSSSSSSSLRGNHNGANAPPGAAVAGHRQLQQLNNPGDMHCDMDDAANDGTVICSFRTFNSVDAVSYDTSTHLACLSDPARGYDFCVNARVDFDFGPNNPAAGSGNPPPGVAVEQQQPAAPDNGPGFAPVVVVDNTPVDYNRRCPEEEPPVGGACATAVPWGAGEASCLYYGQYLCTCSPADDPGWTCMYAGPPEPNNNNVVVVPVPGSGGGGSGGGSATVPVPVLAPVPAPVPMPVATITAEINTVTVDPPQAQTQTPPRVEEIGFDVEFPEGCPGTKPSNGDICEFYGSNRARCPYLDAAGTSPTGWITCDCTKYEGYLCRDLLFYAP